MKMSRGCRRYLIGACVIGLTVALSPSTFAVVHCEQLSDNTWICSGYGEGGGSDNIVVTNVLGVCTNCIAMSPAQCEQLKSGLDDALFQQIMQTESLRHELSTSTSEIQALLDEGDQFLYGETVSTQPSVYPDVQYQYYDGTSVSSVKRAGMASIYRYYNEGVKPSLQFVTNNIREVSDNLFSMGKALESIGTTIKNVDCSECNGDGVQTGPLLPGGGGGGSSSGCPCTEQFNALKQVLDQQIVPMISDIDTNVRILTNLVAITQAGFDDVRSNFANISNLFVRLDDYILDDFSNRVIQIRIDVGEILQHLTNTLLYIDGSYSNADVFVDREVQPYTLLESLETVFPTNGPLPFDEVEYSKLSWFGRVELLLARIAGVESNFQDTNELSFASVSNQVAGSFSSLEADVKSFTDEIEKVGGSLTTVATALRKSFGKQTEPMVILRAGEWIKDQPLTLSIDPSIQDSARIVFLVLWTVGAIVTFYLMCLGFGWMFREMLSFFFKCVELFVK